MYSNANPIFTIFTSPKLIGTICIPELNDFHHSIPYKTLILLSRKKASPLITFFAQTLKCNTKVTFEFLNPNIFTKLSIVTFASVNSLKKTLSNLVITPKGTTFITLFSTVTTFCTDTPFQAKYCTLGTRKGFRLPTIFLVIVVVFVLKLKDIMLIFF